MALPKVALPETIRAHRLRYQERCWALGYGCAWLGRKGEGSRDVELELLHQIHAHGFRYFDTAPAYGESEIRVGQFVREIDREAIFLASKVSLKTDQPVGEQIVAGVHRSLERLQTSWIDLIQVHDIQALDRLFPDGGKAAVMEAVEGLKAAGLIRNFGLASRPVDVLQAAVDSGRIESILTFSDFSPVDPAAWRLIRGAAAKEVATIHGSPLIGGALAGNDPRGIGTYPVFHYEWRRERAIRAYDICQAHGVSTLAVALQFPLREAAMDIMLTGPASTAELQSTLDALSAPVPESLWAALAEAFHWSDYHTVTPVRKDPMIIEKP